MPRSNARQRGRPRSFNDNASTTIIQSLDKALALLRIVAGSSGLSLTEIAEAAGQPPSSAYRVLITLQKHGMVEFDEDMQLWHVGVESFRIGSAFLRRTSILDQSRSVMQEIMMSTGETANLAIADRGEIVFVSQVETHEPIRAFFRPGTRGPIHASGIGKAMLAYMPGQQVDKLVPDEELAGFTPNTITSRKALLGELETIRGCGWAVDDEERNTGMRCIAAPIFNAFGEAVAGISVSGPSVRVTPDRDAVFGERVRQAAAEITRAIGGTPPELNP
ncbi:MAG: IclR family transcriptional regulator [Rhodobiaceae bacterium]|nr:IclR family transcriptional regulator [Rhodobiaceae bacterium]MCC0041998.1 IclR family transcriptional regulator [Rhodobiaceae bacterium]